jgi:hypothetical protein
MCRQGEVSTIFAAQRQHGQHSGDYVPCTVAFWPLFLMLSLLHPLIAITVSKLTCVHCHSVLQCACGGAPGYRQQQPSGKHVLGGPLWVQQPAEML